MAANFLFPHHYCGQPLKTASFLYAKKETAGFSKAWRFAKQEKPYVFATLENTTPENAVKCLNYLKKQYDEC